MILGISSQVIWGCELYIWQKTICVHSTISWKTTILNLILYILHAVVVHKQKLATCFSAIFKWGGVVSGGDAGSVTDVLLLSSLNYKLSPQPLGHRPYPTAWSPQNIAWYSQACSSRRWRSSIPNVATKMPSTFGNNPWA